jgi:hypothetical protein
MVCACIPAIASRQIVIETKILFMRLWFYLFGAKVRKVKRRTKDFNLFYAETE